MSWMKRILYNKFIKVTPVWIRCFFILIIFLIWLSFGWIATWVAIFSNIGYTSHNFWMMYRDGFIFFPMTIVYCYRVELSFLESIDQNQMEIYDEWLSKNIGKYSYAIYESDVLFLRGCDAMAFKLRWL